MPSFTSFLKSLRPGSTSGLKDTLRSLLPRYSEAAAENPSTGDALKSLLYGGAAAVPATELANKHIYGGIMKNRYTDDNGVEQVGLSPQGRIWEGLINTGALAAFFSPSYV